MNGFRGKVTRQLRMTRTDTWWWISVPYSVLFPLLILIFGLKESVGHSATLFLFVGFLVALSSLLWLLVTTYKLTLSSNDGSTWMTKTKVVFALLAVILWIVLLVGPA